MLNVFLNNFTAAYWVLSNAESSYRIENKDSSEKDLDSVEEPMKSAILLMRKNLPTLELRGRLFELGCYEKNGVLHCPGKRLTLLKSIIHYANIYLTLRMLMRENDEE